MAVIDHLFVWAATKGLARSSFSANTSIVLSKPHVIHELEIQPKLRSSAQNLRQQKSGFRRYPATTTTKFVDGFAAYAHRFCQFALGDPQRI